MALWKEPAATQSPSPPTPIQPRAAAEAPAPRAIPERPAPEAAAAAAARSRVDTRESVIAPGLSIEGKISGTGNVRIAGQFKGEVQVEGGFTIETGARHHGDVRAGTVSVGGELTGNISARHVDVTAGGVIVGDVKADTLTVASGSRMRGHVEFGWGEGGAAAAAARPSGNGTMLS
jgi:cytoskeletal protein CcmA (bactofilin family)